MDLAVLAHGVAAWAAESYGGEPTLAYFDELFGFDGRWVTEQDPIDFATIAPHELCVLCDEDYEPGNAPDGQGFDPHGNVRSVPVALQTNAPIPEPLGEWEHAWISTGATWPRRRVGVKVDDPAGAADLLADLLDAPHVVGAYAIVDELPGDPVRPFSWPIDFGVLPDAESIAFGDSVAAELGQRWPDLARVCDVATETDEVDILLLPSGEIPPELLVGRTRAGIVLFQGATDRAKLEWAASIGAGAVGFVADLSPMRIVDIVRNFGHHQPFDVAFWVPPGPDGHSQVRYEPEHYQGGYVGDALFGDRRFMDHTHTANAIDLLRVRTREAADDGLALESVSGPAIGYLSYSPKAHPDDMLAELQPQFRGAGFAQEGDEGSETGAIATNIEGALSRAGERRESRRLQARLSALGDAGFAEPVTALVRGRPNYVTVRVAPGAVDWLVLDRDFPPDRDEPDRPYSIDIEVRAPGLIDEPVFATIQVPVSGPSTLASVTLAVPDERGPFRIDVVAWYRGRPVQRAVIESAAVAFGQANDHVTQASFTATEPTGVDFGKEGPDYLTVEVGRDEIRFVEPDHTSHVADRATLDGYLSEVQDYLDQAGKVWVDGGGADPTDLLIKLAYFGALVRRAALGDRPLDHHHVLIDAESQSPAFPVELLYDGAIPDDGALLCAGWADGLGNGAGCGCDLSAGATVCPLGFWALGRSVTRALSDAPNPPSSRRHQTLSADFLLYGVSQRVDDFDPDLAPGIDAAARLAGKQVTRVASWAEWTDQVEQGAPDLLVAVVHHETTGGPRRLELAGNTVRIVDIDQGYVSPTSAETAPIAFLLGCTTGVTHTPLEHPVLAFSKAGAKIVFGTLSIVYPEGSVGAAVEILNRLGAAEVSVGELAQRVRQDLVAAGNPMGMTLTVHGDPEWKIAQR